MLNLQSEGDLSTFSFKLQRAKLEKDIKEIFYKNNCHKLNITIDDLLGECDLPSQDAIIGKKWKSLFWQQEKKFKRKKTKNKQKKTKKQKKYI